MKKIMTLLGIVTVMAVAYVGLRELFIYYGTRPLNVVATVKTPEVNETEKSLALLSQTHESLNSFLNFGKANTYTEGDWKQLQQWFQQENASLQGLPGMMKDQRLKRDVERAYNTLKLGVEKGNMQLVIYGHRIYHDLDILVNKYSVETNIWHYTEFENKENVKAIEAAIEAIPK